MTLHARRDGAGRSRVAAPAVPGLPGGHLYSEPRNPMKSHHTICREWLQHLTRALWSLPRPPLILTTTFGNPSIPHGLSGSPLLTEKPGKDITHTRRRECLSAIAIWFTPPPTPLGTGTAAQVAMSVWRTMEPATSLGRGCDGEPAWIHSFQTCPIICPSCIELSVAAAERLLDRLRQLDHLGRELGCSITSSGIDHLSYSENPKRDWSLALNPNGTMKAGVLCLLWGLSTSEARSDTQARKAGGEELRKQMLWKREGAPSIHNAIGCAQRHGWIAGDSTARTLTATGEAVRDHRGAFRLTENSREEVGGNPPE